MGEGSKLKMLLQSLHGSLDMVLKISALSTSIVEWWINVSYAVHPYIRSHTGTSMSMGLRSMYSTSFKRKINTRSSTEVELVCASNGAGQMVWIRYFLKSQHHLTNITTLNKDNASTQLLTKNGKISSS